MVRRPFSAAVLAAALLLSAARPAAAARDLPVDLELVLAVDISGSVDAVEARLQRDGYVQALRHADVIRAVTSGVLQRIAVAYVEWSGEMTQIRTLDWRLIDGRETAEAVAREIAAAPYTRGRYTSISEAIRFSLPLFQGNGYEGTRRVIDISGDGPNNSGGLVTLARDQAVAAGVVINGLPIVNDRPNRFGPPMADLDLYYRDCVIGGPGAFLVVARDFESFAIAVRRKLVLEIAGLHPAGPPSGRRLLHRAAGREAPPCDAGERQLQRRFLDP